MQVFRNEGFPRFFESLAQADHCRIELLLRKSGSCVFETDILFAGGWDDVDVHMRHLEARDDRHRAGNPKCLDLSLSDALSNDAQVSEGFFVEISEARNLLAGYDEDVAIRDGLVGADGDADVVGPYETPGNIAFEDLREYTHGSILRRAELSDSV